MFALNEGGELLAYYFGQQYGRLRLEGGALRYSLRSWSDGTWSAFQDVAARRGAEGVAACTGEFFQAPLEEIGDLARSLAGLGEIAGETLELGAYRYRRAGGFSNRDGSWTDRYLDLAHPDQILDLFVRAGKPVGMISCDYFESVIFTSEEDLPYTPAAQWYREKLSRADRGWRLWERVQVPMRDGIRLNTEVYLPADYRPGERLPAILSRTPYDISTRVDICLPLAAMGYALVFQDCRGRGGSEGEFLPFIDEGCDGEDTLIWAERQPWCNGSIGGFGGSYGGYYQWPLAFRGRESLKCIAPFVSGGSCFEDHIRRGGSFQIKMLPWFLSNHYRGKTPDGTVLTREAWERRRGHRPVTEIPKLIGGEDYFFLPLMARHIERDSFWKDQDFEAGISGLKIPVMLMSGPFDGDNMGNASIWRYLERYDVKGRRLLYGPWGHALNTSRRVGCYESGADAPWYCLELELVRFYDRYLKGIQNGVGETESEVRYFPVGGGRWRESRHFPPARARKRKFYLAGRGGALTLEDAPPDEGSRSYRYDPTDAPPQVFTAWGPFGGGDYATVEKRQDVLVFRSEPFGADAQLLGDGLVELYAASDAPDTDFVARLTLEREGKALLLADNLVVARFRGGFERQALLTPGEVYRFHIRLPMMSFAVRKGERLHLEVCSGMKDLMTENPNTGGNIFTYTWEETVPARQTIYFGGAYPSGVELSLLEGEDD